MTSGSEASSLCRWLVADTCVVKHLVWTTSFWVHVWTKNVILEMLCRSFIREFLAQIFDYAARCSDVFFVVFLVVIGMSFFTLWFVWLVLQASQLWRQHTCVLDYFGSLLGASRAWMWTQAEKCNSSCGCWKQSAGSLVFDGSKLGVNVNTGSALLTT